MSAFIVGHDHIDGLLTFAAAQRYGHGVRYFVNGNAVEITQQNATEIGRILLTENERSVRHRYPNDAPGELPGTIGENAASYKFREWTTPPLSALMILKACDCFDYQACETDNYNESLAYKIVDAIRQRAISYLPGYDDVPGWDLTRTPRGAPPPRAASNGTIKF